MPFKNVADFVIMITIASHAAVAPWSAHAPIASHAAVDVDVIGLLMLGNVDGNDLGAVIGVASSALVNGNGDWTGKKWKERGKCVNKKS